jgi:hypothetical protein
VIEAPIDPARELLLLARVHVFPVRHHSPRSSAVLSELLARVRPEVVLIEGPEDATPLLPLLVDPDTRPPVAILGYRTDGLHGSCIWPFAAYSPEYVAARWGLENGADVAFIDLPVGCVLALNAGHALEASGTEGDDEPAATERGGAPPEVATLGIADACARARGHRGFEEFWEASFEAPSHDGASFCRALLAYAELMRTVDTEAAHRARDAVMARAILDRVAAGARPEDIVAVVGAAHAAAFVAGDLDPTLATRLPRAVPAATTLIPFSFPRLAEQLGYGAGNRAPLFYQRAHDARCSFERATLEVLVGFATSLRRRGFTVSLADTLEAYRLALALARLRDKSAPGLDELREAATATLCRGDATHVDGFLWPDVIGQTVGAVATRAGRTPLEVEFWREVEAKRLPRSDSVEGFTLKLDDPVQRGSSVFLHRLRIAAVPYAERTTRVPADLDRVGGARASATARLARAEPMVRLRETWEAQWTPTTDIALRDRIVLGETLERVVDRVLAARLAACGRSGDATTVLLDAMMAGCPVIVARALEVCDRLTAADDDLASLARSASVLSRVVTYGASDALSSSGGDALARLCAITFTRAVARARAADARGGEASRALRRALRELHEVALSQPLVDRAAWLEAATAIATSYVGDHAAAGLVAGLLHLGREFDDAALTRLFGQRLSDMSSPARTAAFLEGFFEVNALALVKSASVTLALDRFLTSLPAERFVDALPVLRRAFAELTKAERRNLLQSVAALRGADVVADPAASADDRAALLAIRPELSRVARDLDELL